ncbi:hypothetical protein SDRG_00674 [Saprolegnia diclina VS20]|uniref:F-box domain-containing protein n=1 Tax=Saprolegnia diclina (strain VS20) TaxID=1156394 RepID=T0R5W0_SAPDV|nr:hypothetical protein SDRG_00674 [Saprolegnia diclina VS20]EQC41815.1 hypothetical protein SDRG_00674 [Saprolegnia diclina VS20]|eukprot:XP_008604384.1 hypothetical protein SDRG_00674 [Saprolegnia diclina VS20]
MSAWEHPAVALEITRRIASLVDVTSFLHALPRRALDDALVALLELIDILPTAFHHALWPELRLLYVPTTAYSVLQRALPAINAIRLTQSSDTCSLRLPSTVSVVVEDTSSFWDNDDSPRPARTVQSALTTHSLSVMEVTIDIPPSAHETIYRALAACRNVRRAHVRWAVLNDAALHTFVDMIRNVWPFLEHLHLESTASQSAAPSLHNTKCFYDWLKQAHVTSMVLEGVNCSVEGGRFIVAALFQSKTLSSLRLLDVDTIEAILLAAKYPPRFDMPRRLTTLQIGNFLWRPVHRSRWASILQGARLRVLELAGSPSATSMPCLDAELPIELHKLGHLHLTSGSFSSSAFASLVSILRTTTTLQTLNLRLSKLSTRQIKALSHVLPIWLTRCGTSLVASFVRLGAREQWRSALYVFSGWQSPLRCALLRQGKARVMMLAASLAQLRPPHAVTIDLRKNALLGLARCACVAALATTENVTLDMTDNEESDDEDSEESDDNNRHRRYRKHSDSSDEEEDVATLKAKDLGVRCVQNGVFASANTTHTQYTPPDRRTRYIPF